MADKEAEFTIQESTVYRRDETPMGLFGWTWTDMGVVAGTFMITKWITGSTMATLLVTSVAWLYVKKWKDMLPERFITKFIAYNLDRENTFRALGRDTNWAPPVISTRSKSPLTMLWESLTGPPRPNLADKARETKRRENLRKRARARREEQF